MSDQSLARMFWNRVEKSAGSPAHKFKQQGAWKTLSWREVGNTVRELTAALVALGRRPGDAVGILSTSRAEWVQADFAIFSAGGMTIPIYPTYPPDLIEYIVNDAGMKTLIVEDPTQLAKVLEVDKSMPGLEHIVDHAGLRGARAVPADIHLGGAAAAGPGKGRLPQGRAGEAGGRHHARGRRHHRLHLRHHRTAQGRGADPRQSLVRPGVRGPDHLDIGGRRPPALPAPRALLRAARVLHRRTPRALHRLCREHRQAPGEPPRDPASLHLQRAAGVREGLRGRHGAGRGRLAGEAEDLQLGGGRRQGRLATQAGQSAGAGGPRFPVPAGREARVLEDAGRPRRPAALRRLRRRPPRRERSPSSSTPRAS